jgi:HSP20 family molecular chaperone IbpA
MPSQRPYGAPQGPLRRSPPTGYGATPPESAVDYDPETGRLAFDFAGLGLTQERTDDAYLLDIDLRGLPAEQVSIQPVGGGLVLAVQRSAETSREETSADGRGYRRSWSFSSGQQVKRLPAPPDADIQAMQRQDSADAISIVIPRRTPTTGAAPRPPGQMPTQTPSSNPPPSAPEPAARQRTVPEPAQ